MDNNKLEEMIREVMASMETGGAASVKTEANHRTSGSGNPGKLNVDSYPLGEKNPDLIQSPTGKKLDDLTLEKLVNGEINSKDLKIRPETLYMQADIAEAANRRAFARNLRRAAELISVEDEKILDIYNALRPNRSSKQELLDIAKDLEENYNASINAALVRNAAEVYEKRDILRRD